jgi:hypothetical protein
MPYIGTSPSNGVRKKFTYTATAGQTSFSGNDDNGISLVYTDTEYLDVYQNGVKLVAVSDYASTTGTSVVLTQGASVSDTIEIIAFDVFSVADTVSATDGGNFGGNVGMGGTLSVTGALTGANATLTTADNTDTLTLKSTDADANKGPNLVLQRDSASPADGDVTGFIEFKVDNDAAEATSVGEMKMHLSDASDGTEDSELNIRTITAGTLQNRLKINSDECAVNEGSTSADFRVESDSMSHQLHMNGSNGKFTINANSAQSPASHFTLFFASASYSAFAAQETDGGSGAGFLICRKSDGSTIGQVKRNGTADEVQYVTTSDYRLKENVNYDFDATTTLKKLKPCEFNWISDEKNTTITGFLAHEVQEVYPHATSGEKDAMETYTDSDGKEQTRIEAQGIEKSDLVPLLVKTIQELEARITALESK